MRVAFLLYPLLELWSLIQLGAETSAGLAALWVLGAGFAGMAMIRFAGAQVLSRFRAAQREGALQQQLLTGELSLGVGGLLLIIPGLVSDMFALLVLIRPLRLLLGYLLTAGLSQGDIGNAGTHRYQNTRQRTDQKAFHTGRTHDGGGQSDNGVILEGEFKELDPEAQQLPHQASQTPDSRSP